MIDTRLSVDAIFRTRCARKNNVAMDSIASLGDQLVVEVSVSDLGRSLAVYAALGFSLERRDTHFAALRFEGREFFLDEHRDLPAASGSARANVRILVPNVDAMWELVQRLHLRVERPIENRYYGLRDFTVLDPDGFGLRFAGPVVPAIRRADE